MSRIVRRGLILEDDKKITPKAWQKELDSLLPQYEDTKTPYARTVSTLACIEILEYNRTDLERMLANEKSAREKQERHLQSKSKKHNKEI